MAQITYETSRQLSTDVSNNISNLPKFFTLKNDGEEAIVRFMHDNTSTFEIHTLHQIKTADGKFRNANCIRDPREPLSKCPLCNNGYPIKQRFYIHLIQYEKDEAGNIIAQPAVWERSVSYAETLKSYLDNYGPLSDIICKVIRHGASGDKNTKYEIVPNLSKEIFPDSVYIKIPDAFKDYSALKGAVLNKSFEELEIFTTTGQFPIVQKENESVAQTIPAPSYTPQAQPAVDYMTYNNASQYNNQGTIRTYQNPQAIQRPIRHY